MKETSETHLVIKPNLLQPLKQHNPKTLQNGKIITPPTLPPATAVQSQASSPSPPSKNRSRRRNRGGRKSDQGDICMRPSSRPRKPPVQTTPAAAVSGTEIVAVSHQMHMGGHSLSKNSNFAPRPGFGQLGTKCIVKANHFLADLPTKDLNHYDVSFKKNLSFLIPKLEKNIKV